MGIRDESTDRPAERRPLPPALERRIALSRLALLWERLWPALAPLSAVILAYCALSWLGQWNMVEGWSALALRGLWAALALLALLPLRSLRWPSRSKAIARLDATPGITHQPLASLLDAPVEAGPVAASLWQHHRQTLAAKAARTRVMPPRPDMARRDPYALRAALALLAIAGFVIAGDQRLASLRGAPTPLALADNIPPRIDLWLTPPAYTNLPPVVLEVDSATPPAPAPQGSVLSLRGSGSAATHLRLVANGEAVPPRPSASANAPVSLELKLQERTELEIETPLGKTRLVFEIIPDAPPVIILEGQPVVMSSSVRLRYRLTDDYGVVRAQVVLAPLPEASRGQSLALSPPATPRPLVEAPDFPLPLPKARPREAQGNAAKDLTTHPWAGLTVRLQLQAHDDAGNTGRSQSRIITLPARAFAHPAARILAEQRRTLALDANRAPRVGAVLALLVENPALARLNAGQYLALRTLQTRIADANTDDELRTLVAQLWEVALLIEDGNLSVAEARLRQAQEKLEKALKEGASDEELRRLMDELRAAMNDVLRETARKNADKPQQDTGNQHTMSRQDLEKMLKRMEEMARSGNREAAQAMLDQFREMMNALRNAPVQQGNSAGKALDELTRDQQQLMDRTFRERNQNRQDGAKPDNQDSQTLQQLQDSQQALRERLKQLREATQNAPKELGDAEEAMGKAEQGLKNNDPAAAVMDQGRALEELRRGARKLQSAGRNGQGQQPGQGKGQADPLHNDDMGMGMDGDTPLPEKRDAQRSREILEELRRRLADPDRPKQEQDYLERLLRP